MTSILTARWLLPITSPPIDGGAVAIENELILEIGNLEELHKRYPHASVRDFGNCAILPGLLNVHTHLELTVFRGRLEESHFQSWIRRLITLKAEKLSSDDLMLSARLGCIESIRAGVTTLADTSDSSAPIVALIESGLRGSIFQEVFGPDELQAGSSLEGLKARLDAHAQRLNSAGREAQNRITVGVSPHAPYSVSAKLYQKVVRLALDRKLDVAIHAAESADEAALLRDGGGAFGESLQRREIRFDPPGCSTIGYFDRLGVLDTSPLLIHCVTVDESDIALMAAKKARVAHCPKSNAKFGHGVAPLNLLRQAGLPVGLGTDSAASNNNLDLIEEARFCSMIARADRKDATVCSADEMLRMMTIDGARTLGIDHLVGSVEPGKQADLIVVDLNNPHNLPAYDPATAIIFSSSGRDVIMTMVAGRVIYADGHVSTIDEKMVGEQILEIQNRL